MIGFNTVLPLNKETTVEMFLEICRKWQKHSPYRTLEIDDKPIVDGLKYINDQESMEFVVVAGEVGVHCGVRYIKKDVDCEWRTDVVGLRTNVDFNVTIVTSRANFNVATYTRLPLKPYIVSLFLQETGVMLDDGITVEVEAKSVTRDNLSELASIINNKKKNLLPVVYVSKHFYGNHLTDPKRLALKLSGLAHVYFESDTSVSHELRHLTNEKNAYNGNIGIYWPNGDQNYYYRRDDTDHILNIINFVKKILNTRKIANENRWSYVQGLKYQSTVDLYRKGESEQKDLIEYALEENQDLKEQIESLESENRYLHSQVEILTPSDFNNRTAILLKGSEQELFPNEQIELVREILEEKLRSGSCSKRVEAIISSILASNENSNNKDVFINKIKLVLNSSNGLSRQGKRELQSLGFELSEDGKHFKIKIKGDERFSHSISKSPSDVRAAKNNFSEFKERFL
ncbi:hypothetical protein J19TS2_17460 [Cohnella xylanilytica]|uniref:Uncharacterized protein n=1 Tax=Cohnella xylanilytica TaxID=557555 RepID=A0A841TP26_9BACL|nr:hypothetical protein [Cohnella xylanilytica]MBB6690027.1 hypothetical protein [Cohnella xylanilytica]GIO12191.1 hypothetical protein J19TS2_17460 [Cohnella xylanilytica]